MTPGCWVLTLPTPPSVLLALQRTQKPEVGAPRRLVDCGIVPDHTPNISRDEVAHLARLARLAVTDAELDVFAGQLDVILGAVAKVGEVAAADIPPTSHAVPMRNVTRPDELQPCLPREAILAAAPAVEDGKFRVPRILSEEA
jgi:aspartyl-tRNA(Asn)/glutamyl-tRNA(Gln) amidotransferase subunit C